MLFFITGNENKLRELKQVLPAALGVEHKRLDLIEIQSLDAHEVVEHKLHEAYKELRQPVLVEDVSARLKDLKGLPGTFVKYFENVLGPDSLFQLAPGSEVEIVCTMGYFDGEKEIIVDGIAKGRTVAPRGDNGFGFDCCVVQEGQTKTNAELPPDIKNAISHRRKAAELMVHELHKANIC